MPRCAPVDSSEAGGLPSSPSAADDMALQLRQTVDWRVELAERERPGDRVF